MENGRGRFPLGEIGSPYQLNELGLRVGTIWLGSHTPHLLKNELRLRKLPSGFFAVNQVSVHNDFKQTSAFRDQCQGSDILFEFQKLFRQTDGFGFVVSNTTVLNCNF